MADVQHTLGPYHPQIRGIVEQAWAEWRAVAGFMTEQGYDPVMYSRTIANHVFDAIARNTLREFADNSSVHVRTEPQTIKLFFGGTVLGRFKKGNDAKLGQNIPTQAVLAFEDADGVLPGLPPETAKVEFIWIANDISTRLEHVLVVARDGDRLVWEYPIDDVGGAGAGTVVLFPTQPPPSPPSGGNEGLVKPKARDNKKPQTE
jgi:hypothetical protein